MSMISVITLSDWIAIIVLGAMLVMATLAYGIEAAIKLYRKLTKRIKDRG